MQFDQSPRTPPVYIVTDETVIESGTGVKSFAFDPAGIFLFDQDETVLVPWSKIHRVSQRKRWDDDAQEHQGD